MHNFLILLGEPIMYGIRLGHWNSKKRISIRKTVKLWPTEVD